MKKIAITQSNYIPWKGYFDLISAVDEMIIYDDMQYTRRDWRNRNKIKTPQGLQMIKVAKRQYISLRNARFINAAEPDKYAAYGVASGIFNVRLDKSNDEWLKYVHQTLDILDRTCKRGFAFNCLTSYSDKEKMKDYLYYADPCQLFDLCKKRYSRQVALLHDYGLYEFTILVRKAP